MSTTTHHVAMQARRVALEGKRQAGAIHYASPSIASQRARRWQGITNTLHGPQQQPAWADCSSYITWVFWTARHTIRGHAGADVVNGEQWEWGYTGTMIQHGHLHEAGVANWYPGRTCVFYGNPRNPPTHVALYMGHGKVISHGQEAGPLYLPWNYRTDFHQARAYEL